MWRNAMPQKILAFAPRSVEEAAELFRACSAAAVAGRRIRVGVAESPFGPAKGIELPAAHSSIDDIARADGAEETLVLVSHSSMNGIYEISRSDFLAVAGGGVKLGPFVEEVRRAGLYFPHESDLMTREATIAGIIMGGAAFRTERRFGRLREYILSLELVTPGGEIIRTGSRSVKDVTGYDLTGFLMGGGGRCGMIVRTTIRLLPPPGTRIGFMCEGDRNALESLAGEIRKRLNPAFLELRPEGDSAPGKARLIGELQSAVRGREQALLGSLSGLAPEGVRISRLEADALAATARPGGAPLAERSAGGKGTLEGEDVVEELERRLYRVFDPQGIMLP
jgi:FAD/FMN-containing dehydrogenase